jgi:hypothetical protein
VEEGAIVINDMVDCQWGDEEQIFIASINYEVDISLVQNNGLSFRGDCGLQEFPIYVTANKKTLPKISHSDEEAQLPTPLADHCILAECNGLGTFFTSGDLG